MVRKRIKEVLNKKLNDWLKSIDDGVLVDKIRKSVIVTGGAIVNMLLDEKVNDFDVYFKDGYVLLDVVKHYVDKFNKGNDTSCARIKISNEKESIFFIDGCSVAEANSLLFNGAHVSVYVKSSGVAGNMYGALEDADEISEDDLEKDGEKYQPVYLSSNAITLSNKIQLVLRFFGEPEEIHKNFDFVHCTCYWTSWDNQLVLPAEALEAIINKQLVFCGSKYPICSILRMRKFIKRGFNINAGQVLKICMAMSKLDLCSISVLNDQLTGVDSSYFSMLIDALQKKKEEDSSFNFGAEYVTTIVDRIFG
ncbi:MAG: hypothetical protein WC516_06855 [Patescibacteria group bacterium]|jgi:hypothetical protein